MIVLKRIQEAYKNIIKGYLIKKNLCIEGRPKQSQGSVELLQEDESAAEIPTGGNKFPQIKCHLSWMHIICNTSLNDRRWLEMV